MDARGFPPKDCVLEQRKTGSGLCSTYLETTVVPPYVLLLAQALLDAGEALFWKFCWQQRQEQALGSDRAGCLHTPPAEEMLMP